ncbi:MAG: CerR family C-terminal domain-containing protein [Burkholderiales bacterium]|nr:CerR family C-terminal domain-containing protein [Burkholderiales bacterium]
MTAPAAEHPAASAFEPEADIARKRLAHAALQLFADQGYAKTSIRQIAGAARTNIATVSYYFGDKAGLYRAVFQGTPDPTCGATPVTSLDELFGRFLKPLNEGERLRLWVKLYRREMLEPTGLWQEKLDHSIRPMHGAVVALLCRMLGLAEADDDVRRLAISIVGLAAHLFISCDVVEVIAPQLILRPNEGDVWRDRLVLYAEAMIEAERRRRRAPPQPKEIPA